MKIYIYYLPFKITEELIKQLPDEQSKLYCVSYKNGRESFLKKNEIISEFESVKTGDFKDFQIISNIYLKRTLTKEEIDKVALEKHPIFMEHSPDGASQDLRESERLIFAKSINWALSIPKEKEGEKC